MTAPPYRDIYYPLNVFMHILTQDEGGVAALHYGFFDREDEPLRDAQERATSMLLQRLPPPPARILDAGCGLGTTLSKLLACGYDAIGINPDEQQIAMANVPIIRTRFEDVEPSPFDAIVFQESSQYIDSAALFAKAREMTSHVIVFDEFGMNGRAEARPTLHSYEAFVDAARANGFSIVEDLDVSHRAMRTIDYLQPRFDRHRPSLVSGLGVTNEQIDALIAAGVANRARYASGTYTYRVMQFRR